MLRCVLTLFSKVCNALSSPISDMSCTLFGGEVFHGGGALTVNQPRYASCVVYQQHGAQR